MAFIPAMMAVAAPYMAAGGAILGGISAIQGGRQASAAAQSEANMTEYNAKMADIQAKQAYSAAGQQEDLQRKRARAAIGNQIASSAEAGAGLNGDLLRQSIYDSETDALSIRYDGALKAQWLTDSASMQRSNAVVARDRASQATTGSYLNAAGSILNAGTSYYKGKK